MKKKHFYARLLPLLIPACALDTPVAESEARFDDPLGEDLEPWCESACEKSTNCGRNEDDCAEKCIDSFTRWFIGKGEICEAIALGVMDCFDTVTCSQLAAGACDSEAIDRCEASQQVSCTSHGMGDGESDGNSLTCSAFYDRCTDGRYYAVECAGSDPLECSCTIDGTTGGRFRFNRGSCPESFEAREICAWPIVPLSGEPTTPPVICNAVTVNGPAGACQIDVGDCADAATYGVICDGATKMCTCLVDGEAVRDFIASESVCPYVLDPDGGAAALNAACGFSIAWSTVIE